MPKSVSAEIDLKSLAALILETSLIACIVTLGLRIDAAWLYAFSGFVVATRQHALLILLHDAVHGHIARPRWLNDALINVFAGIPALLPVEMYRPLHLLHHRTVGTDQDPERRLLYARQHWRCRPLRSTALLRQLLGDLLVINGVRTLRAWRQDSAPPRVCALTIALAGAWVLCLAAAAVHAPLPTLKALLLWFVPLLTVTQLLQKLRSYAEHSGGPNVTPLWPHWTYSWNVGAIGRATLWPYNINYHREHHDAPRLRWHELPGTSAPPGSGAIDAPRLPGARLWRLLHAERG